MKLAKRGRPHKNETDRKSLDLRIPVTAEQKDTISQAAKASGDDMAAWARPILLDAAKRLLTGT